MIKYNQMKLLKNSAKYINRLRKIQASQPFEEYPLRKLASSSNLIAFKHYGIWQCADTLREIEILEEIIKDNIFFKK